MAGINTMTLKEAQNALDDGHKIKHHRFTDGEFLIKVKNDLIDEHGVVLDYQDFWNRRTHADWQNGWSLYVE